MSFVDLTCAAGRKHVSQLLALQKRAQKPLPVEIQLRMLPLGLSPASRAIANAVVNARRFGTERNLVATLAQSDGAEPTRIVRNFVAAHGLNAAQWDPLLARHGHRNEVDDDLALARKFGVVASPTFFVNGRRFSGHQPDEAVDAVIAQEVASSNRALLKHEGTSDLHSTITEEAKALSNGTARARHDSVPPGDLRPGPSPIRGAAGAPVTLTVFTDFYCPHSAQMASTVKALLDEFAGKIRVVHKHRPVPVFPASRAAACAAIAAHEQGKFWDWHDRLLAGLAPGVLRDDTAEIAVQKTPRRFLALAADVKLDVDAFRLVMEGERCQKEIDDDLSLAVRLGVTGTPTTFVNGRRVVGAAPLEAFRRIIEDELKKPKGK